MHPREFKDNDLFLTKKEAFAIDDERRRLIQENEKLTGQLRKIDRELSMLKYKESESFDRTASHMANEYVEYKEPVAIRYDFDGYGYKYMDAGSGSDWQTRVKGELLYTTPPKRKPFNHHEFGCWWFEYGSGLFPLEGEDQEEHAYRVANAAWQAAHGIKGD